MKIKTRLKARIKEIQKIKGKQTKRAERATERTLERFGAIVRQDARKLIGSPAKGAKFTKQIVDGREYMGIERSAFLIGADGTILKAWYKISPKDTPAKLLEALGK